MNELLKNTLVKIQRMSTGFDLNLCKAYDSEGQNDCFQPIFILGAPRSGTTIFYQFLISHFELGYFSNLMTLFPKHLSLISTIQNAYGNARKIKASKYGYVPGLFAPNEAGALFRFFFDSNQSEGHVKKVRATFHGLAVKGQKALVCKNIFNALRINQILHAFPRARFIVVRRGILYNAQDLLKSREDIHGGREQWFSLKPPMPEDCELTNCYEQVVWQVLEINRLIETALIGVDKKVVVDYEDFCTDPQGVLRSIESRLSLVPSKSVSDFSQLQLDKKKDDELWPYLTTALKRIEKC